MALRSEKSSGKKHSKFVYKPRTAEQIRKRAERPTGRFDSIFKRGFETWRPKQGENVIRFLPPTWEDFEHYAYSIFVHRNIGPDNSTYLCPNKMLGKVCAICKAAKEAADAGEDDEAKDLRWQEQEVAWIIDRDGDPETPVLYQMSPTMDTQIVSLCSNKRSGEALNIDDPDEGYDVSFERRGQGKMNTKYIGIQVDRDTSPVHENEKKQDKILEYIMENPIPDTLQFFDNHKLESLLSGMSEETDEDLDGDDEDSSKKSKKSRRRDDDDDDGEEETPRRRRSTRDEEEDEETPRRRKSSRDEEEDEPEEDEAPRRRRSSRDEEEPEEEAPRRRRAARDEEEPEEDEAPRRRRSSRDEEESEPEEETPRRKKSKARDEEEDEETPRRRKASRDDEDGKPWKDDDDGEEDDEPPSRRGPRTRRGR